MKILKDILYKAGIINISGPVDIGVSDVCFDSRHVREGSLFVAIRGIQSDGHSFIPQVTSKGAIAIVCETLPDQMYDGITYVQVHNSSIALAHIASNFFDNPSEKLKLIGITGTNGKTTTATLLFSLFRSLGYKAGLLSTVKNQINDKVTEATHTTPDPLQLNSLLATMVEEGCTHAFMEVSSHAIVQKRTEALNFSGAVFTNITHDHLDYHQTFSNYLKAKKELFDSLPSSAFALSNIDDKNGTVMLQNTKAKKFTYSMRAMADYRCRILENDFSGLMINIDNSEVVCRLVGSFNAYNLLAVYATALLCGEDKSNVLPAISLLAPVEGRFDYIISPNKITGIVDYAHTPDALQNVLSTIHDVSADKGRIITIIGCGGDRDKTKRPVMARIAADLSTRVILTSDNPRSEDPADIIHQMEDGIPLGDKRKVVSIIDRREAIKTAVSFAEPGDVILVAGKGHEKYQEVKGVRAAFDDKQILQELFKILV